MSVLGVHGRMFCTSEEHSLGYIRVSEVECLQG